MPRYNRSNLSGWLAIVAALAYFTWPLGYVLNPLISKHGLASELGAYGQPFNWLFIGADVASGLLALVAAVLLWQSLRTARKPAWVRGTIINFGLFGVFTAIDAALPLGCSPSVAACPGIQSDPFLLLHGIASVAAVVCLGLSAVSLMRSNKDQRKLLAAALVVCVSLMLGSLSIVFFFVPGPGALAQHFFITICSLWIAVLPFVLINVVTRKSLNPVSHPAKSLQDA